MTSPLRIALPDRVEDWRRAVRPLLAHERAPEELLLSGEESAQLGLFGAPTALSRPTDSTPCFPVPRGYLSLLRLLLSAHDPERHQLAYRLLWRLTHGEPELLDRRTDPDVTAARRLQASVRRAAHKMKAFVRFREVEERFIAWYRPEHRVLPLVASFFIDRFGSRPFAILTPEMSLDWDGTERSWGPGAPASSAPDPDALEDLWKAYYAAIFNPARTKPRAMQAEMPKRHWATLPEAELIPELLRGASQRVEAMQAELPQPILPPSAASVAELEAALSGCQACPRSFQVGDRGGCRSDRPVPGRGPISAPKLVIVGEQPGDVEDRRNLPFVGPAGQLLTRLLERAFIDPREVRFTNAVRCFHHTAPEPGLPKPPRIHQRPSAATIERCRPWIAGELTLLGCASPTAASPALAAGGGPRRSPPVLLLGATAALSVLGRRVRIETARGRTHPAVGGGFAKVSFHPAAILRARPQEARELEAALVEDLKSAAT